MGPSEWISYLRTEAGSSLSDIVLNRNKTTHNVQKVNIFTHGNILSPTTVAARSKA
jgi:hypothetical protein